MPFQPGVSGNAAGRPKGSQNKSTASVKAALCEAFEKMGGVPALLAWGKKNPEEFYKIWAKMMPTEIQANVSGKVVVEIAWEDVWTVGDARTSALAGSN